MKKMLIVLLVFGMAPMANAIIIDVIPKKINGMVINPDFGWWNIQANDVLEFALHLVDNDSMSPSYPSYDGYWLKSMDLMIIVHDGAGGAAKATLDQLGDSPPPMRMQHNALFGVWSYPSPLVVDNKINKLAGVSVANDGSGIAPEKDLGQEVVWNLKITLHADYCYDGFLIDLALNDDPSAGSSFYTKQPTAAESWFGPGTYDIENRYITNSDLGDFGIPEPMTIALLGLGGLAILRRRRI